MTHRLTTHNFEAVTEDAAISWFRELGYTYIHGPTIAPGEPAAERDAYTQVVLEKRLHEAVARINPGVPGIRARGLGRRRRTTD